MFQINNEVYKICNKSLIAILSSSTKFFYGLSTLNQGASQFINVKAQKALNSEMLWQTFISKDMHKTHI